MAVAEFYANPFHKIDTPYEYRTQYGGGVFSDFGRYVINLMRGIKDKIAESVPSIKDKLQDIAVEGAKTMLEELPKTGVKGAIRSGIKRVTDECKKEAGVVYKKGFETLYKSKKQNNIDDVLGDTYLWTRMQEPKKL